MLATSITITVNVGSCQAEDLTVASGAILNLGSGQIELTGDIVNDGTINGNAARIKLTGSTNQSISTPGNYHIQ